MIRIMKASAGSGKTWNLARQYIRLLLERRDEFSYRHILAVTFTNKATDEMKDRIIKELYVLSADPKGSDYFSDFVPSLYPDAESLSEAASVLLCNILHDYSAFSVSTIDRFFQQTLKAFAREIGQFSSYAIELDKESLVRESVDRLLDSLTESTEHSRSLEWMTRKTLTQLEEGDGYKLEYTLRKTAERLNSEEFRIALEKSGIDEARLYSDERLNALEDGCRRICDTYVEGLAEGAGRLGRLFDEAGIDPFATSRHFMSEMIRKYSSLDRDNVVPMVTDAVRKNALDVTRWFPKAGKRFESMVTAELESAVADFIAMFDMDYKVYATALLLRRQAYGFAVANDLYACFNEVLKEKNVLTIDQTNKYLRDIIDGSDTPFVYEKMGVRYDHFLLDEFQDTSLVQWDNFRPLLDNSVSGGNDNLIVGDVKQSIYRFRQSDWDLLERQVQSDFPESTQVESLDTNYRSCREIVEFNNRYFKETAKYLDRRFEAGSTQISDIYADVEQKVHKEGTGMVEVAFCEQERLYPMILDLVHKAVESGFRLGEVTVLVRFNKEGGAIAEYLVANGVPVVSDDSLKVSSAVTVRRLVSLLAGIENPEDSMSRHLASSLGIETPSSWHSMVDLCEELLRRLYESDKGLFDSESLYIQSFMDLVADYVSKEGNSLRGFIKKWSEDKSNISSPKSDDAVRIMTIHKSKGLDFPYVIFPSLGEMSFYSSDSRWSRPDVDATDLEGVADGIYDVHLSEKSRNTLFEGRYMEERQMQFIDNINVLYVAMTRASKAMTILSGLPSGVRVTDGGYEGDENAFSSFSQWTLAYMASSCAALGFESEEENEGVVYRKGSLTPPERKQTRQEELMTADFRSWPLNPAGSQDSEEDVRERGRLKFSSDAVDFFAADGGTGVDASNRIRGVVLHDILSRVYYSDDLEASVRQAVDTGELTAGQAVQAYELLSERIGEVEDRGWFPQKDAQVFNERDVIDQDGEICRPDRVVISEGRVMIVDYKFGEHDRRYVRQVRRYADVWRRMGYEDVSAYLWYVQTGEVVETF